MKKIFFLVFINLMGTKLLFSQFEENLTNGQFNKVITAFKGQRSDFGSYYLNNFPCTACSGGYFFINDNSNLSALYSYKGVNFTGTLNRPHLKYDIKGNTLYVSSNWNNTGSNGGYKSAYISFEYSFRSDFNNWNTILRFISGNIEMVAYYNLTRKQLDDIYSFVLNDTKYKEYLLEIERKKSIERRKIFIQDSLKKIEEDIKDSLKKIQENIQKDLKLKDDLQRKYIRDSIIKTLEIGSEFEDGIVINFQNNNSQAILLSKDEFYIRRRDLIEAMNELKKDGLDWNKWQIPTYGNMVYVAKLLKNNKKFKKIFFESKLVEKEVNNSNFYWSDSHYLQLFGSGTFNILISYDMPLDSVSYTQNAFLRYIRIAKLN